ncbi:DNA polymerase III subunit beta [Paenibacillus thermotolerans]|uniref:DNA polymerase III subunit beta n=1 Tax=Paenibacillus thermotolerans TaxID=3027807 RepID=UPI002367EC95|nr:MULTISPECIES: DNA polymerase III subunit beta [unclassified Paenibacillus]
MKFSILKSFLNESIQHVNKAISSRTTIPILSGIKIEASAAGLTLVASDTDISIQSFIPAEIDGEPIIRMERTGSVVVPAKFFVEIVRKLPSSEVNIEVAENHQIGIQSGTTEIQLAGLDPEEFPLLPRLSENQTVTMPSEVLRSMIRQVVYAVTTNESTPILTGVLWSLENGRLKMVATDRHRLASIERPIDCSPELRFHNIVISGKNLSELSKIMPEQNTLIDIVVADNQVLFRAGNVLFYTRILDGTYPDTSRIIPTTYVTEITFASRPLSEAIDRAYLLSREEKTNIVKMVAEGGGTVEISSSSSELGRVTENLPVQYVSGEPLKISFNSKYFLDVLKVTDEEAIRIGFAGAMKPMVLRPVDEDGVLHLILPYRTVN